MTHNAPSPRTYLLVFFALLALLAATVAAASVDLGWLGNVVAVTIAAAKALLIMLYFMHLRYSRRVTQAVAFAAFLWLGILLTLALCDYQTRRWPKPPQVEAAEHAGRRDRGTEGRGEVANPRACSNLQIAS